MKIDLHIHSYYSDGELSPEEIIDKWESEGYEQISITDHDGINGSVVGIEYAKNKKINVVPGIEFDSEDELGYDLHILGYNIDFDSKALNEALNQIIKWRDERNKKLIRAINESGYEITIEEVNATNDGRYIGKPNIAKVLIERGYVNDVSEAFSRIIKALPDANDTRKQALRSKDVIDIIHQAGGIAIFAHPMEQKNNKTETWEQYKPRLDILLNRFLDYGVDGIECFHPSASKEQSQYLLDFANKNNLIITAGSDFHYINNQRDYSMYHK